MSEFAITKASSAELVIPESRQEAGSLMAVITRAASDPAMDVEKVERLMALYERVKAKQAEQIYNDAMAKTQAEMPVIFKDAINTHTNSKYAKLENVIEAVKPIYSKNGFSLVFSNGDAPEGSGKIRILCKVSHSAGHSEVHHLDLSPDDTGAKGNPTKTKIHGEASTISYIRRYLVLMVFNIATQDDIDGGGDRKAIEAERMRQRLATQQAPPKPQPPSDQPKPQSAVIATEAQKAKFIASLEPIRREAGEYFSKIGVSLNTLEDLPLSEVPTTQAQFKSTMSRIEAFCNGQAATR